MNTKERWIAAMTMKPVDRLPFWPKITGTHYLNIHKNRLPKQGMSIEELNDYFGSDELLRLPEIVKTNRTKTASYVTESDGSRVTTYETPLGKTRQVHRYDAGSASMHPVEFPISNRSDLHIMTRFFEDAEALLDEDGLQRAAEIVEARNGSISTMNWVGKSALMQFVENLAGVEQAHYLLADHETDVVDLFEAIHRYQLKKTELIAKHSPADAIYLIENTSTTLISPGQFRTYCYRHLEEYGKILTGYGRIYALHMCGHLKALFPELSQSSATVFEAFTSPPVGNTRLIDGRGSCPGACLVGGTNAVTWTMPTEDIIAYLNEELDALPHHRGIVVTSAGVMPPMCNPETIRAVAEWVRQYPVRN